MLNILLTYVVPGLWIFLFLVWRIAALQVKETQRAEAPLSRFVFLAITVVGFALSLTGWFRIDPLAWRFVPRTFDWVIAGCLIEALGTGFAIAARFYLGKNWSGTVTIKVDHQ